MSAEVVKKRGRPKKVISDLVDVEVPENAKKATTRSKSTKAAPKPAPTKFANPKTSRTINATPEAAPSSTKPPKSAPTPPSSSPAPPKAAGATTPKSAPKPTQSNSTAPAPSTKTTAKSPVTPETSKILSQVRELAASKAAAPPADLSKSSKPSPTSISPKPSTPPPKAPQPPPKVPLAALNSQIVNNISTRAGARPNTGNAGSLPKSYKSAARKVTATIVALPILLVTSYVLYQRLVLGEDKKILVKPGLTPVDTPEKREGNGTVGKESSA